MKLVEDYLHDLRSIHYSDAGTDELTYYHPLLNLLNVVGRGLKPKVKALGSLADAGAGHPDIGLFSETQAGGQLPERGVIEVKGSAADVAQVAGGEQVARYLNVYRQVLVTNYWDFVLVGREEGRPATLESFRLAESEADFWRRAAQPRKLAREQVRADPAQRHRQRSQPARRSSVHRPPGGQGDHGQLGDGEGGGGAAGLGVVPSLVL